MPSSIAYIIIETDNLLSREKNNDNILFMKKDIHPPYYKDAKVKCACGAAFTVGSTKPEIQIEICGHCHPFYTGKGKLIDIAGRVEKFRARKAKAATIPIRKKSVKKSEKKAKKVK